MTILLSALMHPAGAAIVFLLLTAWVLSDLSLHFRSQIVFERFHSVHNVMKLGS